jgi:hypothetical protein
MPFEKNMDTDIINSEVKINLENNSSESNVDTDNFPVIENEILESKIGNNDQILRYVYSNIYIYICTWVSIDV